MPSHIEEFGKPILLRPPIELRKQLEEEAEEQSRSLNNLVIVILEKYFSIRANGSKK